MSARIGWVYGLFDKHAPGHIRYSGKTKDSRGVEARIYLHLWGSRPGNRSGCPEVSRWIQKIGEDRVGYRILEEVPEKYLDEAEVTWIAELRSRGQSDLNVMDGGQGVSSSAVRAEKNPNRKLTWGDVRNIRRAASERPLNRAETAEEYGVTPAAVSKIILNRTWYDPDYDPERRSPSPGGRRSFTDEEVETIREEYLSGSSISEIRDMFEIPHTSARRILFDRYGSEETRAACRAKRGPKQPRAQISEEKWRNILDRHARGESQDSLSREFGVSQAAISDRYRADRLDIR